MVVAAGVRQVEAWIAEATNRTEENYLYGSPTVEVIVKTGYSTASAWFRSSGPWAYRVNGFYCY
jgi:hypothetical protein